MNNGIVRTIILALAVAFFSFAAAQFRMVFFRRKTLREVVTDPKTYCTGILGIVFYVLYNHLVNLLIYPH